MSKRLSSGFKERGNVLRNLLLNFEPIVRVKKSIPQMTILNVINDIGSSVGLWLGFSTYSVFKMLQSASYAWSYKKVDTYNHQHDNILDHDQYHETLNQHYDLLLICTMIILMMSIYLSILQPASYAWATGRTGPFLRNHLSLIIATLVTLGSFALAGVFICISLDA